MSILAESVHCIAVCVDMAVSDRGDFCQVLHLVDIATVSTERLCDIIMYKRRQGPPKTFSQIVDVLVREKKRKKKRVGLVIVTGDGDRFITYVRVCRRPALDRFFEVLVCGQRLRSHLCGWVPRTQKLRHSPQRIQHC